MDRLTRLTEGYNALWGWARRGAYVVSRERKRTPDEWQQLIDGLDRMRAMCDQLRDDAHAQMNEEATR